MLRYGACYYPEHWTAEQAKDHIKLMVKARFNVVRMGEFAWSRFEADQGRYKFDWLDRVIEALHKEHIDTVLCTPTAIPPMWMLAKHPNILQVDDQGHKRNPGARNHCCKNAPEYQMQCDAITQEMAKHYAGIEGVIGWQTDNEFGCHNTTRCYCDHCEKAFRQWLIAKYKTVEAVNEAWGTIFWGFEFRQWTEIPLPRRMPTGNNPSHWLDYARFSSDTQVAFHVRQRNILKQFCPNHFVTHNCMGRFDEIDYHALWRHCDVSAWDNYPDASGDPLEISYSHAITRAQRGTFWVLEQKSGSAGDSATGVLSDQPEPAELRRWAWQTIANGGDGVCYFRWRACLFGAEQYWHGILDHDGVPRRRYKEVLRTGEEFMALSSMLEGTRVESKVALIRDFSTLWSLQRQPGAEGFCYDDHCFELFRAVRRTGHTCDVIATDADLKYPVVLAPSLTLVDQSLADRLTAYVEKGGTLVLTAQSGARTVANTMHASARPGPLAALVGATVEEINTVRPGKTQRINFAKGALIAQHCEVTGWYEILECTTAEVIAEYLDGRLTNKAAIVRRAHGKGQVYYLGVYLPQTQLEALIASLVPDYPVKDIPEGVEITQRKGEKNRLVFIVNHMPERRNVKLPGKFTELLSSETVGPDITVSANGVLILKAAAQ